MHTVKITDDISWIGVHDYTTYLFEGMWPIDQKGINYNAYIINDDKVVLIDTVKSTLTDEYLANIKSIIGDKKVDYLVVNHMEPDHSSSMYEVLNEWPDCKIVGNKKTFPMIRNFYGITENYLEVENGDELNIGSRSLQFFMTPMVHWPESMVTYDQKTKTLFSMDVFGSFNATVGSIFDDKNDVKDFEEATYRYYACIVGKVTEMAQRALKALAPIEIKTIAPSHGLVWRKDPAYILNLYVKMANAQTEPGVVIAYGTMYGNTRASAEIIANELRRAGVETIKMYDVGKTNISYILGDIWKYKGVILGAPSYYGQIFPPMENLLYKLAGNKLRNHVCGFFTDFSWSGGANRVFEKFITDMNAQCPADMVNVQGAPQEADIKALKAMALAVAMEVNE